MDPLFRSREYSNPSLPTMNRPSASPQSASDPSPHSNPPGSTSGGLPYGGRYGNGYSAHGQSQGHGHSSGQGSAAGAGQGLDRILQSPRDLDYRGSGSGSMDGIYLDNRSGAGSRHMMDDRDDHIHFQRSDREYGNKSGRRNVAQSQAALAQPQSQPVFPTTGPTAKRGSKACAACMSFSVPLERCRLASRSKCKIS